MIAAEVSFSAVDLHDFTMGLNDVEQGNPDAITPSQAHWGTDESPIAGSDDQRLQSAGGFVILAIHGRPLDRT